MTLTILGFLKKLTPTQWILAILLSALGVQTARLALAHRETAKAQEQARVAHLGELNAQALLDSTRRLTSASLKALGDSLVLSARQVVQMTQKASQLDKELGQMAVANYALTIQMDTLRNLSHAPTVPVKDSLTANFLIRQPPYHGNASVALPMNGEGRLNLTIAQDPLHLAAKLSCGKEVLQARPAQMALISPNYVQVQLDSLSQDPNICSPAPQPVKSHTVRTILGIVAGGMVGWLVH